VRSGPGATYLPLRARSLRTIGVDQAEAPGERASNERTWPRDLEEEPAPGEPSSPLLELGRSEGKSRMRPSGRHSAASHPASAYCHALPQGGPSLFSSSSCNRGEQACSAYP
jgi:hypothetical protein